MSKTFVEKRLVEFVPDRSAFIAGSTLDLIQRTMRALLRLRLTVGMWQTFYARRRMGQRADCATGGRPAQLRDCIIISLLIYFL